MTDAVIEFAEWVIQESVFDSYDPEKHGVNEYAEPGSDWYVFSNLLTQTDPSPAPEAQQDADTRPSEQAVTEAMVEAAIAAMFHGHGWFPPPYAMRAALKAAMEAGR